MKHLIVALTLLALTAPVFSQAKPSPTPMASAKPSPSKPLPPAPSPQPIPGPPGRAIDKAAAEELVKQIEPISEAWALGDANLSVGTLLDGIAFNAESAVVANDVFNNKNYKGLAQLFMFAKIMVPLCRSDAEAVQAALPTVSAAVTKMGTYQDFRKYTDAELKAASQNDMYDPKKPEESLKRLGEWEEARRGKLDTDGRVAKNNLMLYEIARNYARMLLLANKPGEDEKLVALILKQEADKHTLFIETLNMIATAASNLDQAQSTRLYRSLEKAGRPMTYSRGAYMNPGAYVLSSIANSTMTEPMPDFPGVRILTTMNALAPKANLAVVEVPNGPDIDAVPLLAKAKEFAAKPGWKDANEACVILGGLLKTYPTAKCAPEAKDTLARARLMIAKQLINSKKPEDLNACKDRLLEITKESPGTPYETEAHKLMDQLAPMLDQIRAKKTP